MRFLELMERVKGRGAVVAEMRAGGDPEIRGVCEDSRKARAGDLFVARAGTKTDGLKFVGDAFSRGAVAVIYENSSPGIAIPGITDSIAVARVENANLAAAILAHEVTGNPTAQMKMIGITGTKGKTTVAYLMRSVLKAAGFKVGMIGTVEIDDGVTIVPAEMTTPGSVELVEMFSRMKANGVTHCVMEVSSHALHQRRVAGIDWAVAIFTNLTGDHLDYHGDMEKYAAAKAMLFEGLKEGAVAVINMGDSGWAWMTRDCRAEIVGYTVSQSVAFPGEWTAAIGKMSAAGMSLGLCTPAGKNFDLTTPLVGRHNAFNLTAVVAAARALGVKGRVIRQGIEGNLGAPGRLQAVVCPGMAREEMPFQVFVDYAHTHDALENVLTALRSTMGTGSNGPSAGGMLLTQDCRRGGEQVGNDRDAAREPSQRQKHGTRVGVDALRPLEGGTPKQPKGCTPNLICVFGCGGDRDRIKRPKMGAIAERLADVVIVTSDNPRTESPAAIIEEICAGFSAEVREALAAGGGRDARVTVEPDRRAAIKLAIGTAKAGDVVLLAGKGHENYQIVGTVNHHFDDVEEAEAALRARMTNEK